MNLGFVVMYVRDMDKVAQHLYTDVLPGWQHGEDWDPLSTPTMRHSAPTVACTPGLPQDKTAALIPHTTST